MTRPTPREPPEPVYVTLGPAARFQISRTVDAMGRSRISIEFQVRDHASAPFQTRSGLFAPVGCARGIAAAISHLVKLAPPRGRAEHEPPQGDAP